MMLDMQKSLKAKIESITNELNNTKRLAKIGYWKYKIQENKLIWDDEAYEIFEVNKEEFPTLNIKNYLDLISIEDGCSFFEIYNNHLNENNAYLLTHKIVTQKGNIKYIQARCETIFDKENKPIVSNGTIQDVTEQKNIQLKLDLKNQQILEQSRLTQMRETISMIAHQWRQPLTTISATSSVINIKSKLGSLDRDTAIELSDKISKYSQQLSETIDNFREFFKPNNQKIDITYDEVLQDVLNIIEISIVNKNIKLIKNLNSKNIFNTYSSELSQVILNLLKNAKEVLLKNNIGNPTIKIETYDNLFTVSDNGGGVPEDIVGKIFDPYFSTKTKKDGIGLGLYMSKTIIEEHCGGKLSVSNCEDGAMFRIELENKKDD